MNSGAALESSTASMRAMDFTAMKKSNWQMDPATLRKICSQGCCVLSRPGPSLASAGRKTRKLMPYCRKSSSSGETFDAALLSALITAAQKKAAVIKTIPAVRFRVPT